MYAYTPSAVENATMAFGITVTNSLIVSFVLAIALLFLEGVWVALKTETVTRFRTRVMEIFVVMFTICGTLTAYKMNKIELDLPLFVVLFFLTCFAAGFNAVLLAVLTMALQGVWTSVRTETVQSFGRRYSGVFRHAMLMIGSVVVYELYLR